MKLQNGGCMCSKKIRLSIILCMTSLSIISEEMPWNHYVQLAFDDIQTAELMQAMDHNDMRTFSKLLVADYELANTILLDDATFDDINPIHYAAKIGNKEMMRTFLTRGIDINKKSSSGKTPLYYAIINNQDIEFINFLLQHGANPLAIDDFGNTMLHATLKAHNHQNRSIDQRNINLTRIRNLLIDKGLNPEDLHSNLIDSSNLSEISNTAQPLQVNEESECPICQETTSDAQTNCCKQPICKKCFVDMNLRGLNSCPVCRHPNFTITSTQN